MGFSFKFGERGGQEQEEERTVKIKPDPVPKPERDQVVFLIGWI
jgi:hypothetical protein